MHDLTRANLVAGGICHCHCFVLFALLPDFHFPYISQSNPENLPEKRPSVYFSLTTRDFTAYAHFNTIPCSEISTTLLLDDQVYSADRTEATVIPGEAQRRPGIQEIRRSAWIRSFRGNDGKNLIIEFYDAVPCVGKERRLFIRGAEMRKRSSIKIAGCGIAGRIFTFIAAMGLAALFAAASAEAAVIYVDSGAGGANDGSCWTDAYTDLQDALGFALSGDEIWVAAGTYKPTSGAERSISFVLVDGVGLYGGFSGFETARDQRDWETNAVSLSGDIGTEDYTYDNSYQAVKCGEVTGSTVLDGFTISGGRAWGADPKNRGGGMYNDGGSPTVTNCTFSGNSWAEYGGGMYNDGGSPTVTNCTFSGNSWAEYGGGMYNDGGSPALTDCTFSGNSAISKGGGMYIAYGSPTVTNCTFTDNHAGHPDSDYGGQGGGMYNAGSPTVTNCTFSSNSTLRYSSAGGGMYNAGSPTVINCTFIQNCGDKGLGIHNRAVLTIKNTILADNGLEDLYNSATIDSTCNIVESYAGFTPDPTDITGDQPSLEIGPLADNGGGTWTHALLPGSVAIDAGTASGAPETDQRGVQRYVSPDIGAYELVLYYVEPLGDCGGKHYCYSSIQSAIDDAHGGDVVLIRVAEGDYNENAIHYVNASLEFGWNYNFSRQDAPTPAVLMGPDGH